MFSFQGFQACLLLIVFHDVKAAFPAMSFAWGNLVLLQDDCDLPWDREEAKLFSVGKPKGLKNTEGQYLDSLSCQICEGPWEGY